MLVTTQAVEGREIPAIINDALDSNHMMVLGSKVYNDAGPEVAIDCLWCGRQSVKARTRQQTEWLTLFHFFPLLRIRNVFVRCSA